MTVLLENSGGMSAEEFSSKIRGIKQEFGLVSVGEGGDDAMEVSDGENTEDVNRSQVTGNQDRPKPCPLTQTRMIALELVDTDEDDDNESEDSDVVEVRTFPSKTGSKSSGRSKHKRSLGEVEATKEGGQGRKVRHKTFLYSHVILMTLVSSVRLMCHHGRSHVRRRERRQEMQEVH